MKTPGVMGTVFFVVWGNMGRWWLWDGLVSGMSRKGESVLVGHQHEGVWNLYRSDRPGIEMESPKCVGRSAAGLGMDSPPEVRGGRQFPFYFRHYFVFGNLLSFPLME